jgi:hypothetical protein
MKFNEFGQPDFGDYSSRKIVLSKDGKPARFQIPRLYMPFGISGFTPDVGQKKWNIDFSLKGWNEDGGYIQKFHRFLVDLENSVIDHIHQHSEEIFGSPMSRDTVASMFNSNIKYSPTHDPKLRVKVDVDNGGMIKPRIFDANEVDITSEAEEKLHSRQTGAAIVELNSIYFMNRRFGVTWKLQQLKVFEPQRLKGFQFVSDGADADEPQTKLKGFAFSDV